MSTQRYVPILKARSAEIDALNSRRPPMGPILPVFELQGVLAPRRDKNGKWQNKNSAVTDAARFMDSIAREWPHPMLLDIARAVPSASHAMWWTMLHAQEAVRPTPTGATIMPVVRLSDPDAALKAAAVLANTAGGAAVRVSMPTNTSALRVGVTTVSNQLGLPLAKMIIILDWADQLDADTISLDDAVSQTLAAIQALPEGHGEVVTTGTPKVPQGLQDGYWTFERREWLLWLRVRAAHAALLFGDYALFEPGDPVPARSRYGYLRYSRDDTLHLWREAPPATGGGLGGAFEACCENVVKTPVFSGRTFSPGDEAIADIDAGTRPAKGAAQEWREHSLSHHFALVRQQLATPMALPSPLAP